MNENHENDRKYGEAIFTNAEELRINEEAIRDKSIEKARQHILDKGIEKKGVNNYRKFKYMRLDELTPIIRCACEMYNLTTSMNTTFDPTNVVAGKIVGEAVLDVKSYYCHTPRRVSIPFAFSPDMQDIGSSLTYARRYLYLTAFDIVEKDEIEENIGKPEGKIEKSKPVPKPTGKSKPTSKPRKDKTKPKPEQNKQKLTEKQLIAEGEERIILNEYESIPDNNGLRKLLTHLRENHPKAELTIKKLQQYNNFLLMEGVLSEEEHKMNLGYLEG